MAKIAVELAEAVTRRKLSGAPGTAIGRVIARGRGWRVSDVICTSGPQDRPFEEQHEEVSVAVVLAGTFQYRSARGRVLMTPGSLLLGNAGQNFECSHEHAAGDRCLAFHFDREYFAQVVQLSGREFRRSQLPVLRALSPVISQALAAMTEPWSTEEWEELAIRIAGDAATIAVTEDVRMAMPLGAEARVTRAVRAIERRPDAKLSINSLAVEAGLSPYHFLRVFEQLTGITPHQYIRRLRLREAARTLIVDEARILDIALDAGFGDISNFNRAFRAEFGASPKLFRRNAARGA